MDVDDTRPVGARETHRARCTDEVSVVQVMHESPEGKVDGNECRIMSLSNRLDGEIHVYFGNGQIIKMQFSQNSYIDLIFLSLYRRCADGVTGTDSIIHSNIQEQTIRKCLFFYWPLLLYDL